MFLESDSHSLLDAVRLLLSDADLHRPGRIENVIDKRGLARAEKSGNDRYGDFFRVASMPSWSVVKSFDPHLVRACTKGYRSKEIVRCCGGVSCR
jgi:hypothetical protein